MDWESTPSALIHAHQYTHTRMICYSKDIQKDDAQEET